MGFHLFETLRYATRRKMEQWHYTLQDLGIRDWTNDNPVIIYGGAIASIGLLLGVLAWNSRSNTPDPFKVDKKAWFYDENTGQLFVDSGKQNGPIKAPSGPGPNGEPAGVKAHVYSHVPDPNASELFIGFLEKPNPQADSKTRSLEWGHDRLIKRETDKTWVAATSPLGREILSDLSMPNDKEQTPIYQKAK